MAFLDQAGLQTVLTKIKAMLDGKSNTGHTHNYAGSASSGGSATSAVKLDTTTAGSTTQPVYFTNGKPTAIGYTIAKSVPSNAVFTDTNTHYESKNVVGSSTATANTTTALTNGNVYLNSVENGKVTSAHKISGSGATSVTTDATGNIVVSSTNTTYSSLKNPYAVTIKANGSSLGTYDGSAAAEFNLTAANVGAAAASHNHSATNITSGTLGLDRLPDVSSKVSTVAVSKLSGVIDASHLPSYVDDVLEGYMASDLKTFYKTKGTDGTLSDAYTAETGKIYTDLSTNKVYRWGGTVYVVISDTLALGTTSTTAYRGDLGAAAKAHADAKGSAFASGLYKITTNAQGHVTAATAVTKSDITNLGVPASNTTYTAGTGISLSGTTFSNSGVRSVATGSANGTISVNTNGSSANVAVYGLGSAAYTNSSAYATAGHNHSGTYLPLSGGTLSGNLTVASSTGPVVKLLSTSTDSSKMLPELTFERPGYSSWKILNNVGVLKIQNNYTSGVGSYFDVLSFDYNSGNVTAKGTVTAPTFKGSLSGNATSATTATSATKATQDSSGQQINTTYIKGLSVSGTKVTYTRGDGTTGTITTQDTNTTYSNMGASSASAAGKAGLVPAPAAGAANRYLRCDGTWVVPPDTNTTYAALGDTEINAAWTAVFG